MNSAQLPEKEILKKIVSHKIKEIAARKSEVSMSALMDSADFSRQCISLKKQLLNKNNSGIIAEFKRKSPSNPKINNEADAADVVREYTKAGAAGISVLTENKFFGGNNNDLTTARTLTDLPLLRKDFIIEVYQIAEAKAIGADVILLIAAALTKKRIRELASYAKGLGLEVLLEVHNKTELESSINEFVDMVGVNNRDLKTFTVNIEKSLELAREMPSGFLKISESGINNARTIVNLKNAGYSGFLIGEHFMKTGKPGDSCRKLIAEVKQLSALKAPLKVKVCGMRDIANIHELCVVKPDYIGMIFYPGSPRFVGSKPVIKIPETVRKVGVFVNEKTTVIKKIAGEYRLDFIQLHGDETPEQCKELAALGLRLIKSFPIFPSFSFSIVEPYIPFCDYFLFDTPHSSYGGSGSSFDWKILNRYTYNIPFFLSGGIGIHNAVEAASFKHPMLHALDINSKVETEPGVKDIEKIKKLLTMINRNK